MWLCCLVSCGLQARAVVISSLGSSLLCRLRESAKNVPEDQAKITGETVRKEGKVRKNKDLAAKNLATTRLPGYPAPGILLKWTQVQGSRFQVQGFKFKVQSYRFQGPENRYMIRDT